MSSGQTQQRIARILFQARLDVAAARDVLDFQDDIIERTIKAEQEFQKLGNAADAFARRVRELEVQRRLRGAAQETARTAKSAEDVARAFDRINSELGLSNKEARQFADEFARAAEQARRVEATTRQQRGNQALQTIGREIRALPALPTPLGVSTDQLANIARGFGRLNISLTELGTSLGLVGGGGSCDKSSI